MSHRNPLRDPQAWDTFESIKEIIQIDQRRTVHPHQIECHGFKKGTDYVEYRYAIGNNWGRSTLATSSMIKRLKTGFAVVDREVWSNRMEVIGAL